MSLKSQFGAAALAVGVFLSGGVARALAQDKQPASDNTKVNKRDRSKAEPTADRAKDNVNDRDIMQKIRKSIVDDKSLSTYAHNVKIVSKQGKVTLKGPVRSEEEKKTIEQKATEVAGAGNVTDEMTVKPEKSTKKTS
jgi:hyperosmotically inducible protein